jgi:hypothetical protein
VSCFAMSVICKWIFFGNLQPGATVREGSMMKLTNDLVMRFAAVADLILILCYMHTPLINLRLWLYGGSMAYSSHAAALEFDPFEANLIHIDENCELSAMRIQASDVIYDGMTVSKVYGQVTVMRNAELGLQAVVESDVLIEEGASMGFITRVPKTTVIRKNTVLYGNPGVTLSKRNMDGRDKILTLTQIDTVIRNSLNLGFRFLVLVGIFAGAA